MKLAIYSDLFFDTGFIDSLIEQNLVSVADILFLHPGNLKKKSEEISNVNNFLFLNMYINSIGLSFAEYLIEKRKSIFAVPGDLCRYSSAGTNFLIQTGSAVMVCCAEDLLCLQDRVV